MCKKRFATKALTPNLSKRFGEIWRFSVLVAKKEEEFKTRTVIPPLCGRCPDQASYSAYFATKGIFRPNPNALDEILKIGGA